MDLRILVSPELLRSVAKEFAKSRLTIEENNNKLMISIRNLEGRWQGHQEQKFHNEFVKSKQVMKQYANMMLDIEKELKKIADTFQNADQTAAQGSVSNYDFAKFIYSNPLFSSTMGIAGIAALGILKYSKIGSKTFLSSTPQDYLKFKSEGSLLGDKAISKKNHWFANPLAYQTDIKIPKTPNAFFKDTVKNEQIGGKAGFSAVDAGMDFGVAKIHEKLFSVDGQLERNRTGIRAKAEGSIQDIGVDGDKGSAHLKVGTAKAGAEATIDHVYLGAKAEAASLEGDYKIDLPFIDDYDFVVGGGASFGGIGGEVEVGLMNELDLELGFGASIKFGLQAAEN